MIINFVLNDIDDAKNDYSEISAEFVGEEAVEGAKVSVFVGEENIEGVCEEDEGKYGEMGLGGETEEEGSEGFTEDSGELS